MHRQQQFGARTKKTHARGLAKKTRALREAITAAFDGVAKPVTVRQMFYLLSTRDAVEKTEGGYRRVQRQLLAMRREELIPYSWIADSTRWMRKPVTYSGIADCLAQTAAFYRQAVWHNVSIYIEIWCEKDALAGALSPETSLYDVPLMVARGYSSESFAYEAAENMREAITAGGACRVYYLGDFDPSGWHMSQDLEQRLKGFLGADAVHMSFTRLAVSPEQIALWNLPARPTKRTDTRHAAFEAQFGADTSSVELDAIPPNRLRAMVREAIEQHLPEGWLERVEQEERAARETLEKIKEWAV